MPSKKKKPEFPVYPLTDRFTLRPTQFLLLDSRGEQPRVPEGFLEAHRKDYYLLVYVKTGINRHWVDMKPYNLKPGAFYFTTPDQIHLKEEAEPVTGYVLAFTREYLSLQSAALLQLPIIDNPAGGHELILSAEEQGTTENLFARMLQEYNRPGEWQKEMIFAQLQEMLIHLSRIYSRTFHDAAPDKSRELLADFECEIEEHFRKDHLVSDYARRFSISLNHFTEVIKSQSGKTPIEHIHDRLLLEAKRQLFHSRQSIKEIAFELGFQDASYFNRFFKRITSLTPVEYRTRTGEMYHTNHQD